MKKFNFSKGLVIGLLTLALCFMCYGVVSASADTKKITFKAKGFSGEYSVDYTIAVKNASGEVTQNASVVSDKVTLKKVLDELGKADNTVYCVSGTPTPQGKVTYAATEDGGQFSISGDATDDQDYELPVKIPKVTFTVTVNDMLGSGSGESGTYTFTPEESTFVKANQSITYADILAGMKKSGSGEKTLEDPTAWVVVSKPSGDGFLNNAAADKLSLSANLTKDETASFTVTNSKVPITFTYSSSGEYTSTILIDNKKGDYKIPFTDIVDGLKIKVGEEEKTYADVMSAASGETTGITEYILLNDGITGDGKTTTTGKYSTWVYNYKVTEGLVSSKPQAVPINATKIVPAFVSAGYDPDTDSIKFVSLVNLDVYWTDCKKAAGVSVKGDKLSTLSLTENKTTGAENYGKFEGSISLADKSAGVKVAESKTAYIYASFKAPAAESTKYTANYIVEATPYKKIAVTFGYAQAEKDKTGSAVATITTIDTKKKTVLYSGLYDEEKNKDNWLVKISGTPAVTEYSKIFKALQYSTDGTTWYKILDNPEVNGKQVNDLNLGKLYDLVTGGSKTTLFFRIKGSETVKESGTEGAEDYVAAANAYRASKPVKIAVDAAKAGKAVKVDVSKGTIALKNGYDFTTTETEKGTPALSSENGAALSYTILPFNKDGKAAGTDNEGNDVVLDTIATVNFVPVAKVTDNAEMFTKTKVKSYSIEKIATQCGADILGTKSLYIWIRKSATVKKPADQWVLVTVGQMTPAPTIANAKGASYYIAQDAADVKGVVLTPEVKNASSDKNSGSYEYLIVDASDIVLGQDQNYHADIDLSSAKWTVLNDKGLTVGKSKSKYAKEEGKKATDHILKDGSAVLIRRAGDKTSNLLASDYLVTMITKGDVEIEVEKDGKKEKETKSLFVWKAYSAQ